jgi:hypothetical protein
MFCYAVGLALTPDAAASMTQSRFQQPWRFAFADSGVDAARGGVQIVSMAAQGGNR